jgi:hypothetical protein
MPAGPARRATARPRGTAPTPRAWPARRARRRRPIPGPPRHDDAAPVHAFAQWSPIPARTPLVRTLLSVELRGMAAQLEVVETSPLGDDLDGARPRSRGYPGPGPGAGTAPARPVRDMQPQQPLAQLRHRGQSQGHGPRPVNVTAHDRTPRTTPVTHCDIDVPSVDAALHQEQLNCGVCLTVTHTVSDCKCICTVECTNVAQRPQATRAPAIAGTRRGWAVRWWRSHLPPTPTAPHPLR